MENNYIFKNSEQSVIVCVYKAEFWYLFLHSVLWNVVSSKYIERNLASKGYVIVKVMRVY
jgi:hypothetical protein